MLEARPGEAGGSLPAQMESGEISPVGFLSAPVPALPEMPSDGSGAFMPLGLSVCPRFT